MKKINKKQKITPAVSTAAQTGSEAKMSYGQVFMKIASAQKRGNKSIYVSAEHHERLTRIVQIIGGDKIPLFAYLNNILEHHFGIFEDVITKEFKENYKTLF